MARKTVAPLPDISDDPALNTQQACAYLGGLHPKTLVRLARTRQIQSIQLAPGGPFKFRRSALNAFLGRYTQEARVRDD